MRSPLLWIALALVGLGALGSAGRSATVAAEGVLAGSGTSYTLTVRNTGDVRLTRMTFRVVPGVTITGSDGPGRPAASRPGSFARGGFALAPGASAVFSFTTAASYPAGAGGVLLVAPPTGAFVPAPVTGPAAAPPPPPPPQPPPPPPGSTVPAPRPLPPEPGSDDPCSGHCSLLEFIQTPGVREARALESLRMARGALGELGGLPGRASRSAGLMNKGARRIELAGDRLADAPCAGARVARDGLKLAGKGMRGVAGALLTEQRQLVLKQSRFFARHPKAGGDAAMADARFHGLSRAEDLARDALGRLKGLAGLAGDACRAADGSRRVRSRVVSIDGDGQSAKLADGTTLILGNAGKVQGLAPGVTVQASGIAFAGKQLLAETVLGTGIQRGLPPQPCEFGLRVAPVQNFAQANDEILYYDRRGYLDGNTYRLEGGMAFGADRGPGCAGQEYAMNLTLVYRNSDNVKVTKLLGVLRGYKTDAPARIPEDVNPKKKAILRWEVYGLDCAYQGDIYVCNDGQLESIGLAGAGIRRKGGWARAQYNRTTFSVEDGSKSSFDMAVMGSLIADSLPGDPIVFGVGYDVEGGASTYPSRRFIDQGESFAVHDDVPDPMKPTGLLWAYANGTRNGYPYHYVARLPELVTDVVDFCPGEDSYFRLPWKGGKVQKVTQGNNGELTHNGGQRYAFDFRMTFPVRGHAARGGVVDFVEEDLTKTSNPKVVKWVKEITGGKIDLWLPGNELRLKHQDGTFTRYVHMAPKGVFPEKDDLVERGDAITVTGATGNATGPHLHWQWSKTGASQDSLKARFEVGLGSPDFTIPCVIPPSKTPWVSSNYKPGS